MKHKLNIYDYLGIAEFVVLLGLLIAFVVLCVKQKFISALIVLGAMVVLFILYCIFIVPLGDYDE